MHLVNMGRCVYKQASRCGQGSPGAFEPTNDPRNAAASRNTAAPAYRMGVWMSTKALESPSSSFSV